MRKAEPASLALLFPNATATPRTPRTSPRLSHCGRLGRMSEHIGRSTAPRGSLIESRLVMHTRRFGICDSNLHVCVTSRLELDIKDILDLLTSHAVSLTACALEFAAAVAQLTLIDWQANRSLRPFRITSQTTLVPSTD